MNVLESGIPLLWKSTFSPGDFKNTLKLFFLSIQLVIPFTTEFGVELLLQVSGVGHLSDAAYWDKPKKLEL